MTLTKEDLRIIKFDGLSNMSLVLWIILALDFGYRNEVGTKLQTIYYIILFFLVTFLLIYTTLNYIRLVRRNNYDTNYLNKIKEAV